MVFLPVTTSLFDAAYRCIMSREPAEKVAQSQATAKAWQSSQLTLAVTGEPLPILVAGHPTALTWVLPAQVPRRKLNTVAGQLALLHALAHIEFSAINLAWDAVYRFRNLPIRFYDDWVRIAVEETTHFILLRRQLQQLNCEYGNLVAHNSLWEMAVNTADDVVTRMALIPRVLEARGLDATPRLIAKLQALGQEHLVEILDIILQDEVGHVATGSYWFNYFCTARGWEAERTFYRLLTKHFKGRFESLNIEARLAAGFSLSELENLLKLGRN